MVRHIAILLPVVLCACGEAGGAPESIVVRDSAGVEIVELGELSGPAAWTVTPEPLWSFTDEGTGPIHGVADVAFVTGDRIAVTETSRSLVFLLDRSGQEIARGGTAGPGPREFVRVGGVVPVDTGSFQVVDLGDRTLTTWSMEGELQGEASLPGTTLAEVLPGTAGGVYIAYTSPFPEPVADTVLRATRPIVAWDGSVLDTVVMFPDNERIRTERALGSPAYSAAGLVRGNRSGLWLGDTKYPEIRFWTEMGLARVVRWGADPVPMTPEILSAYLDVVASAVPPEEAPAIRQEMSSWPMVKQVPFWEEMVVTHDGDVWVSPDITMRLPPELVGNPPPRRWIVLDSAGRPAGEVTTPVGFTLLDASGDRIVGVHTDELGVQSVRAYGLSR